MARRLAGREGSPSQTYSDTCMVNEEDHEPYQREIRIGGQIRSAIMPRLCDIIDAQGQGKANGSKHTPLCSSTADVHSVPLNGDHTEPTKHKTHSGRHSPVAIWANHGANHRKCTTHDTNDGRQHRRPSCRHLRGRPRSPAQSYYDYLWKGDQHIISTSTTPPKDNHQKLASPHLRQQSSFYQIGYKPPNRELRPHLPPQGATVTITSPSTN